MKKITFKNNKFICLGGFNDNSIIIDEGTDICKLMGYEYDKKGRILKRFVIFAGHWSDIAHFIDLNYKDKDKKPASANEVCGILKPKK